MKTALTEMEWLEKAAAGAREVLADYRTPTQLYPVDTESTPEERNYLAAQFQAHCVIPLYLRVCSRCKWDVATIQDGKMVFCSTKCQDRHYEDEAEWRAEERYRRAFEARS